MPASIPPIDGAEVQLWRMQLAPMLDGAVQEDAMDLLSADEQARALRMREEPRREFVAARRLLRRLLGTALNALPGDVRIQVGSHGKPRLDANPRLKFNVSHSGGLVFIAISKVAEVGVDVERINAKIAESDKLLEIARAALQQEDLALIEHAESEQAKLLAFYSAWTRKEAVMKADGRGIVSTVGYSIERGGESDGCRVCLHEAGGSQNVNYFVQPVYAGQDHVAALAVLGRKQEVRFFDAGKLRGPGCIATGIQ